jgi:hypothetical protein
MQTTFLTPLPGTRMFERCRREGRLLHARFPDDWDRYDMTEATHRPATMTAPDLTRVTHEANRRMYSWPVLLRKALRTLRATRSPSATLFAWTSNLNYRRVAFAIPDQGIAMPPCQSGLLQRSDDQGPLSSDACLGAGCRFGRRGDDRGPVPGHRTGLSPCRPPRRRDRWRGFAHRAHRRPVPPGDPGAARGRVHGGGDPRGRRLDAARGGGRHRPAARRSGDRRGAGRRHSGLRRGVSSA